MRLLLAGLVALATVPNLALASGQPGVPQKPAGEAPAKTISATAKLQAKIDDLEKQLKERTTALIQSQTDLVKAMKEANEKLEAVQKSADEKVKQALLDLEARTAAIQKDADERIAAAEKRNQQQQTDQVTVAAAQDLATAVSSLRELTSATQVGISYIDYGRRLIDVKTKVENALAKLPEDFARKHDFSRAKALDAIHAYEDAHIVWQECLDVRFIDIILTKGESKSILRRYNLTPEKWGKLAEVSDIQRKVWISTIWAEARKSVEFAESKMKP